jgi:hypothetical protein
LHDPISVRHLVAVVGEKRRCDVRRRGLIRPRGDRVGRDAQQLYAERLELLAVLQVNYLLHASASTRPHAEVEEDRFTAAEVRGGSVKAGAASPTLSAAAVEGDEPVLPHAATIVPSTNVPRTSAIGRRLMTAIRLVLALA